MHDIEASIGAVIVVELVVVELLAVRRASGRRWLVAATTLVGSKPAVVLVVTEGTLALAVAGDKRVDRRTGGVLLGTDVVVERGVSVAVVAVDAAVGDEELLVVLAALGVGRRAGTRGVVRRTRSAGRVRVEGVVTVASLVVSEGHVQGRVVVALVQVGLHELVAVRVVLGDLFVGDLALGVPAAGAVLLAPGTVVGSLVRSPLKAVTGDGVVVVRITLGVPSTGAVLLAILLLLTPGTLVGTRARSPLETVAGDGVVVVRITLGVPATGAVLLVLLALLFLPPVVLLTLLVLPPVVLLTLLVLSLVVLL